MPLAPPTQPVPQTPLSTSVEAYANLIVALFSCPGAEEWVLTRYGVASSDELDALHAHWRARLDRDGSLRAQFFELRAVAAKALSNGQLLVTPATRAA